MQRSWVLTGLVLFSLLGFIVFPFVIGVPWDLVFASDAIGYSTGAKNLVLHGFYTFDGVRPFMDREPMMSFFLVPLYALFGMENGLALALTQGVLLFLSAWFFCSEFARRTSSGAAGLCFVLLLTSGSMFHTVFSAYRECLALILLLTFSGLYLSGARRSALWKTLVMGIVFGLLILTYYPFIFFPPLLFAVYFVERRPLRDVAVILLLCYAVTGAWALRNASYDGRLRVIDNRRTAVMWYVRGEQAERVTGLMPLQCLAAEYITRDWTGLSDACSFNGLMHQKWPDGFDLTADYGDIEGEAKAKIRANIFNYLSFSAFDVLELHLPFLGGGWSHLYNQYASVTMLLLYIGFFAGIVRSLSKTHLLLLTFIAYNTLIFVLTDATPRYLLPVIFCYAAIAGIGYDWLLKRLTRTS